VKGEKGARWLRRDKVREKTREEGRERPDWWTREDMGQRVRWVGPTCVHLLLAPIENFYEASCG